MKDDDFKLLRGFADGRTNEQTFVIVESLSRLKNMGTRKENSTKLEIIFCLKCIRIC